MGQEWAARGTGKSRATLRAGAEPPCAEAPGSPGVALGSRRSTSARPEQHPPRGQLVGSEVPCGNSRPQTRVRERSGRGESTVPTGLGDHVGVPLLQQRPQSPEDRAAARAGRTRQSGAAHSSEPSASTTRGGGRESEGGRARCLGRGEAHRPAAGLQGRRCARQRGQVLCRGGSAPAWFPLGALKAGLHTGGRLRLPGVPPGLARQGARVCCARGSRAPAGCGGQGVCRLTAPERQRNTDLGSLSCVTTDSRRLFLLY